MIALKRSLFIPLLFITVICGESCSKTTSCNTIPNVAINLSIDINLAAYAPIQYTGGSMEVTAGNADGVVIYRYQTSQFMAYDCMCPYDGASNTNAAVLIQSNKIQVKCPVCGSTFNLSTGGVSSGPATCPLKQYNATYDGSTYLTITN